MTTTRKEREGHYYVQALTQHVFVVRRCISVGGKPGSDDRIVRSFDTHYDAHSFADYLNEEQPAQ